MSSAQGEDREMHKSMIDDVERPGAPSHGRFETNPDEHEGHFDPDAPQKSKDDKSESKDASEHTQNASTSGDTDSKPAGGHETGGAAQPQDHAAIQSEQNSNSMSNSNEPNQGFGGSGAQPSTGVVPTSEDNKEKHQGASRPMDDPEDTSNKDESKKDSGNKGDKPKPLGNSSGDADGGMKPPPGQGTGEGTGEQWVKSSGVQADGGDFDATVSSTLIYILMLKCHTVYP